MQQKKSIRPMLFLYYEESLVSSNLNTKLLRFHCAHPNINTTESLQWTFNSILQRNSRCLFLVTSVAGMYLSLGYSLQDTSIVVYVSTQLLIFSYTAQASGNPMVIKKNVAPELH